MIELILNIYSGVTEKLSIIKKNTLENFLNEYEKYKLYKSNEEKTKIINTHLEWSNKALEEINNIKNFIENMDNNIISNKVSIIIIVINLLLIGLLLIVFYLKNYINSLYIKKLFDKIFTQDEDIENYKKNLEQSITNINTLKEELIKKEIKSLNELKEKNIDIHLNDLDKKTLEKNFKIKLYNVNDTKLSLSRVLKRNIILQDFTMKLLQLKNIYSHYSRSKLTKDLVPILYISETTNYNEILNIIEKIQISATTNDDIEDLINNTIKKIEKGHLEYSKQLRIQEDFEVKETEIDINWCI